MKKKTKKTKSDSWSADSRIRGSVLLGRGLFRREELQDIIFRLKRVLRDASDIETFSTRRQDLTEINRDLKEFLGIQSQKFKYVGQGILEEPALERLGVLSDKVALVAEGIEEKNTKTGITHRELVELSSRCLADTYVMWIDKD